ncbi:lantibiotic dehydratase family protein [Pendulispora brunnea]|uniref:Lantibiotic dehydratase family protein n=1 Tax=Pendulispora brunnea TaxID=2905690 RepID=A0ABZ2KAE4_9BACT
MARTARDRPPPSMEMLVHVVADSVDALDRGEFTLVVSPNPGSPQAGATVGRFAYCLPGAERLRHTLQTMSGSHLSQLPVQLHFQVEANRLLAWLRAPGPDPLLDMACDVVELVRAFHDGYGAPWSSWLTAAYTKQHAHHRAFVARRREALKRISLDGMAKPEDAWPRVQLGIDPKSESEVIAIARGAVQAHLDRRRAMA